MNTLKIFIIVKCFNPSRKMIKTDNAVIFFTRRGKERLMIIARRMAAIQAT